VTDTVASLRQKIAGACDLQSVVRTMKAVAASSIGQYERSAQALTEYARTVELGLSVCFRATQAADLASPDMTAAPQSPPASVGVVVFGSDQGLVGQFNERVVAHACAAMAELPGTPLVWAVGERVYARLADAGVPLLGLYAVPTSVKAIAPLIGRILIDCDARQGADSGAALHLFYNRPESRTDYTPVNQKLLPMDAAWRRGLIASPWPTRPLPQILGDTSGTLRALIREYLFVSLFRACAESLASENTSRLAAMQRADKNIDETLSDMNAKFRQVRQSGIDEELFDVVSGFEALRGS
jgi:F-type H+-transporting ATPase subunit gamma